MNQAFPEATNFVSEKHFNFHISALLDRYSGSGCGAAVERSL